MRLEIENIGKVKKACINLNGITVVAGVNSSGKSTIAKAVSCLVNANHKMVEDIRFQKIDSLNRWFESFLFDSKFLYNNPSKAPLDSLYARTPSNSSAFAREILNSQHSHFNSDQLRSVIAGLLHVEEDDISLSGKQISSLNVILNTSVFERQKYVILKSFREKFRDHICFVKGVSDSQVSLESQNGRSMKTIFRENKVSSFSSDFNSENSVVFLEAPSRFNNDNAFQVGFNRGRIINSTVWSLLAKEVPNDTNYEDYKWVENSLSEIDSFIEDTIHGSFFSAEGSSELTFKENAISGISLEMCNVASGVRVFAIIRRLVQNRSLNERSILVIDEPETGLHPEWQIQFARLLGLLSKKMGIKVLLTTHSPYFLRAIEVVSKDYEMQDSISFYLMKEESDGFRFSSYDVTNRTEEIYKQLYLPLERL